MINSHRLLEPYLKLKDVNMLDITTLDEISDESGDSYLPRESRDKLRNSAQEVLHLIELDSEKLIENDR